MGYIAHEAIVVTGVNIVRFSDPPDQLSLAHSMAKELGLTVTEIIKSPVNAYLSFMIAPDGSKEGREESEISEGKRDQWIGKVKDLRHVDWVHVKYGGDFGDEYGAEIMACRYASNEEEE